MRRARTEPFVHREGVQVNPALFAQRGPSGRIAQSPHIVAIRRDQGGGPKTDANSAKLIDPVAAPRTLTDTVTCIRTFA